jgi:hypothetical protein
VSAGAGIVFAHTAFWFAVLLGAALGSRGIHALIFEAFAIYTDLIGLAFGIGAEIGNTQTVLAFATCGTIFSCAGIKAFAIAAALVDIAGLSGALIYNASTFEAEHLWGAWFLVAIDTSAIASAGQASRAIDIGADILANRLTTFFCADLAGFALFTYTWAFHAHFSFVVAGITSGTLTASAGYYAFCAAAADGNTFAAWAECAVVDLAIAIVVGAITDFWLWHWSGARCPVALDTSLKAFTTSCFARSDQTFIDFSVAIVIKAIADFF